MSDILTQLETAVAELEAAAAEPDDRSPILKRFVRLEQLRRRLEETLDAVKARIEPLKNEVYEHFAETGVQNARCDGLTVYLKTTRFVSKRKEYTMEQVCECLRAHGFGYLVSDGYNAAALKSAIVEKLVEGVELPEPLKGMLNIGETTEVATRKS